ncbi:MAG: alanine racemase, partial [Gemmatimonadota bacterium]|nr:alanine racemase [Gemmatimonadota bacterium]
AGIRKPVLLMARAATSDVADLAARGIELALYADDDPERISAALGTDARAAEVPVHAYLDTGMSRMGVRWDEAVPYLRRLAGAEGLRVVGTFMAFTEEPDFDLVQLDRFRSVVDRARDEELGLGPLHAASSNGVFHLPEAHLDMVRPGIALFGAYPSRPTEERELAELVPAVRLRARVTRVGRLEPGDSVSYGRGYVADRPVWVATIPVGHSDGYPREAVEAARVLIGGRTYPVIGAVSASHAIVELGTEPVAEVGDVATLLGPDHPDIHPNRLAAAIDVSVYDLLMHLNPLLPRAEVD